MRLELFVALAFASLIAGCAKPPEPAAEERAAADSASAPADAPAQPAPDMNAPGTNAPRDGLPAEGAISLTGFGPAKFGAGAEEVRMAWGGDFEEPMAHEPGGCHYLIPKQPVKQGYKVAFMIEGERFVRIDVASDQIAAPGGGRIGMPIDELQKRYGGSLQSMPHKYIEGGQYLALNASGAAPGKLVFEADESGKVTEWRVGLTPQVDYVEGCS